MLFALCLQWGTYCLSPINKIVNYAMCGHVFSHCYFVIMNKEISHRDILFAISSFFSRMIQDESDKEPYCP